MKLLLSPLSPYARKPWIISIEKGLQDRIEHVHLGAMDDPPALLAANPVGLVPALVRDDGEALYDSVVIAEYLDNIDGAPRFYPASGDARWTALRQQALVDGMLDASIPTLFDRRKPEQQRSDEWQTRWATRIGRILDEIERQIDALDPRADGLAQLYYPVGLDYLLFRSIVPDWRPARPKLAKWFETAADRVSFAASDPRKFA